MRFGLRLVCLLACCLPMAAEVRLPSVISDHAVLQRDKPVRIWGWSSPGEAVTVKFHDQTIAVKADAYGIWEAWLKPEKAGGPYILTVSGDGTSAPLQRADILVGEVWIASGQSNMEFPLTGFSSAPLKDGEKEIAAANHPEIRLLVQKRRTSGVEIADSDDAWKVCTPESAKNFSAVAYFFARKIAAEEKVPVGVIDSTWGGTPAQSWISTDGIASAELGSLELEAASMVRGASKTEQAKEEYAAEDAEAKAAGKTPAAHPHPPADRSHLVPSALYNGMIAPYVKYTLRGAIWYQGEADHAPPARALDYSRLFPALIQDWRTQWAEGPFPFLFVQISSFDGGDGWATIRDAQRRTLQLGNTGMAVTLDVGTAKNVHPPDKQTVGARLAQTALGMVYGEKVETASPLFTQATTEGESIRAWFSHAEGLKSPDATIGDFEVAGADHKFVAATAKIEKVGDAETAVAGASGVPVPVYIRYAWTPVVKSYLYNAGGLPMGTFTSESDVELMGR
jgi:sialate O-acetylesterase